MAKRTQFFAALMAVATTVGITLPSNAQVNFSDIDALVNVWLQGRSNMDLVPNQATVRSNIETRRSQIEAQISADLSAGRISAMQASNLRTQLAEISARFNNNVWSGGGLTVAEARDALMALRTVNTNLQNSIASGTVGGGVVVDSNIVARMNDLRARINSADRVGTLRNNEANQLMSSLNWIRSEYNRLRFNGLTASEESSLNSYIATVEARFNTYNDGIANNPGGVFNNNMNLRDDISRLRNRIEQAQRQRRISWAQANRALRDLNNVASLEIQYRRSGNGLSRSEFNTLRSRLTNIASSVNLYM